MSQHFLLSKEVRTLSLAGVLRLSDDEGNSVRNEWRGAVLPEVRHGQGLRVQGA
jgi:hypothetical protein